MKQPRYLRVQYSDKMEDSSCPTENRCRKNSSREFRRRSSFHSYNLHRKRCDPTLAHGTRTLEKTIEERDTPNQAVVRIVNGTARDWSIQHEIREIISPASTKQAMEMQAEAERRKREEILQSEGDQQSEIRLPEESHKISIVLSSNHQLKIPEHIANRS